MTPSLKVYRVSTVGFREECLRCVLLVGTGGRTLYIRVVVSVAIHGPDVNRYPLGGGFWLGNSVCMISLPMSTEHEGF